MSRKEAKPEEMPKFCRGASTSCPRPRRACKGSHRLGIKLAQPSLSSTSRIFSQRRGSEYSSAARLAQPSKVEAVRKSPAAAWALLRQVDGGEATWSPGFRVLVHGPGGTTYLRASRKAAKYCHLSYKGPRKGTKSSETPISEPFGILLPLLSHLLHSKRQEQQNRSTSTWAAS